MRFEIGKWPNTWNSPKDSKSRLGVAILQGLSECPKAVKIPSWEEAFCDKTVILIIKPITMARSTDRPVGKGGWGN